MKFERKNVNTFNITVRNKTIIGLKYIRDGVKVVVREVRNKTIIGLK